jgi:hypothetical protein
VHLPVWVECPLLSLNMLQPYTAAFGGVYTSHRQSKVDWQNSISLQCSDTAYSFGSGLEIRCSPSVCDLILLVCLARNYLQRTVFGIIAIHGRPCIARLCETALENLHDAMCICMAGECQYTIRSSSECKCRNPQPPWTAKQSGEYRKSAFLPYLLRYRRIDHEIGSKSRFVTWSQEPKDPDR